jgi:hypothetical protein
MSIATIFVCKGVENSVFSGSHLNRVPANRRRFRLGQRLRGLEKLFDFFFFARFGFELRPNS